MSSISKFSLEELEGDVWSEPEWNSHLVTTCHALRKIPLCELSVENLRMLIGQKIGLEYLVPIAIGFLVENPWCSGDFYDGDLLKNVLCLDIAFWSEHMDLLYELSDVMISVQHNIELYNEILSPAWAKLSGELLN